MVFYLSNMILFLAAPACETDPVVLNSGAVVGCANTQSDEYCTELTTPVCDAGFQLWNVDPYCFAGEWYQVPRCTRPPTGAFVMISSYVEIASNNSSAYS